MKYRTDEINTAYIKEHSKKNHKNIWMIIVVWESLAKKEKEKRETGGQNIMTEHKRQWGFVTSKKKMHSRENYANFQ